MRVRLFSCGFSLCAFGILFASARSFAAEFSWDAPSGCPDRDALRWRIEEALGTSLVQAAPLKFSARVTEKSSKRWVVALDVTSEGSEAPQRRELEAATCDELAQAASVAIALALGADASAEKTEGTIRTLIVRIQLMLEVTVNDSRIFFNLCLLAATVSACSQDPVSIGAQPSQTKTGLAAYAANWEGYVEAYQFIDGTDTVRIAVADDGTGTIRFGDSALLPAASDPNGAYPPDYPNGAGVQGGVPLPLAWDGILFKLNSLRVETERLRASVASLTVFESWCTIQKPILSGANAYACVDSSAWIAVFGPAYTNGYTDQDGGVDTSACAAYTATMVPVAPGQFATVKVPCEQGALCTASAPGDISGSLSSVVICECTESACHLGSVKDDIVLDVALDGAQTNMVGTLALGTANYTIRLKRQ